jgi:hypothetical protein
VARARLGAVMQGEIGQGRVWRGVAGLCWARYGMDSVFVTRPWCWHGEGVFWSGSVRLGGVWYGEVGHG